MAVAKKVYDFPLAKVEEQLVSFLKRNRGESTIADMIAATGLPKYQVEQAAKAALDEYAGRLKVTESGELLYYFPGGMRSTLRGPGPALKRFWRAFSRSAVRVLAFLFKIWIVAMLIGYFLAFVAIALLAVFASLTVGAATRSDSRGGGRDGGGGLGLTYLGFRLIELVIRIWFWTSILGGPRRPLPAGRPFYKSVFSFAFGEGDPNRQWEERERTSFISYVRSHRGVLTLEELVALTGREPDGAAALMNRLLLEYEGEPGVTDEGTVVYSFPELMRTAAAEKGVPMSVAAAGASGRRIVPFSDNKRRTNGWIIFFNAFNLAFGSYFLGISLAQGAAAISRTGPYLYSFVGFQLQHAGIPAVPFMGIVLGLIPVVFSVLFFLVPLLRRIRITRQNDAIREEALRRRVMAQVLASPSRVEAGDIRPTGTDLDPRDFPARRERVLERLAASLKAEPLPLDREGEFAWRFVELERELADLESFRKGIDPRRFELGRTVFDSGA